MSKNDSRKGENREEKMIAASKVSMVKLGKSLEKEHTVRSAACTFLCKLFATALSQGL